jgi:hypothetical protein
MGNRNSSDGAKGAGQDVIQQTEKSSHQLYQYVDLKGSGKLVSAFRRAQTTKDFTEVDRIITNELCIFLYDNGNSKRVPIADLVQKRQDSKNIKHGWKLMGLKKPPRTKNTSQVGLVNESFTLESVQGDNNNVFKNILRFEGLKLI